MNIVINIPRQKLPYINQLNIAKEANLDVKTYRKYALNNQYGCSFKPLPTEQ